MVKAMVVGGGGREHALAEKLKRDKDVDMVFCCPGNGGTARSPGLENMNYKSFPDLAKKAKRNGIELIVIGPEGPLARGAVDYLQKKGFLVFGFGEKGAKLESSKAYADLFKRKYGVAAPSFKIFTELSSANEYLKKQFSQGSEKFWIKADELCGGKGAISVSDPDEAKETLRLLMIEKKCGRGEKVIVQEDVKGEEVTVQAITDGDNFLLLPSSRDHKSIYEGGRGPNTGGMGAFCPVPQFREKIKDNFIEDVLKPTREGFKKEGLKTNGLLYFGLMVDKNYRPRVLEFNVRFGDPEAQPVLNLLETDLSLILRAAVEGRLDEVEKEIKWSRAASVCVILATEGYPVDDGEKAFPIEGLRAAEKMDGVNIYHAGTELKKGKIYAHGGRILGVTASGESIQDARDLAYSAAEKIKFEGMHYRKDIASVL